ncbi:hypothetical protein MYA_5422 [Burkholderia sp. KJ006]|nr:hypothetical protein MYA_5422 [Burkholderia sp. KJ006]
MGNPNGWRYRSRCRYRRSETARPIAVDESQIFCNPGKHSYLPVSKKSHASQES